jgi:hypothetical protein
VPTRFQAGLLLIRCGIGREGGLINVMTEHGIQAPVRWHDALSAVQGGIAMLSSASRTDRSVHQEARQHINTLTLKLAELQLGLMSWAQVRGFGCLQSKARAIATQDAAHSHVKFT